jgi:hypothetical protein
LAIWRSPYKRDIREGSRRSRQALLPTHLPRISETFGCIPGTNREKLLLALHRNYRKQIAAPDLVKAVYGTRKDGSYGALAMVVRGLNIMIKKDRLPYRGQQCGDE